MKNPNKFERNCPKCLKNLEYTNKYNMLKAEKKGQCCKKCAMKELSNREDMKVLRSQNMKGDKNPMYGSVGDKNPFYGKKHKKSSISRMKEVRNNNSNLYKSVEFRQKMSEVTTGENNGMYGKSVYDIWVKKYGTDIANDRLKDMKQKLSVKTSGKNNPMYGKPAPKKSGNGWSGWYNGWYFRSILELSYMINVIERFNLKWKSAETSEFGINYIIDDTPKTYFSDFIINDIYLVELKPKRLQKTKNNQTKFSYAQKFCNVNGLIFKVRDIPKIKIDEFKKLVLSGKVILTDKWGEVYDEKYG